MSEPPTRPIVATDVYGVVPLSRPMQRSECARCSVAARYGDGSRPTAGVQNARRWGCKSSNLFEDGFITKARHAVIKRRTLIVGICAAVEFPNGFGFAVSFFHVGMRCWKSNQTVGAQVRSLCPMVKRAGASCPFAQHIHNE